MHACSNSLPSSARRSRQADSRASGNAGSVIHQRFCSQKPSSWGAPSSGTEKPTKRPILFSQNQSENNAGERRYRHAGQISSQGSAAAAATSTVRR